MNQNLNEYFSRIKAGGTSAGNYFETRADGTVRLIGTATSWQDIVNDLFSKRLYSTVGKVDYEEAENAIKFQSGGSITEPNDRVGGNLEINHFLKVGNGIIFKPHLHWFQDVVSGVVKPFKMTMMYRLQRNNQAKVTTWTNITATAGTDDVFDFTGEADGTYNQLTRFSDITVDCGVSDTFQYKIARTDTETGDMLVYFADFHAMVDSFGSDEEFIKL